MENAIFNLFDSVPFPHQINCFSRNNFGNRKIGQNKRGIAFYKFINRLNLIFLIAMQLLYYFVAYFRKNRLIKGVRGMGTLCFYEKL